MGDTVLVTGINGFIASWICKYLLEEGYNVRGTVRDIQREDKISHLREIEQETGKEILFFQASLTEEEGWEEAMQGCRYVLHTASPYSLTVDDPQRDLVDPAVNGTMIVLNMAKRLGVEKVVLTSSVAAITDQPVKVYTEDDWNEESTLKRNPYYFSKKLAEEAAWGIVEEAKENGEECFVLNVINPFVVIGPEMNAESVNTSNQIILGILTGQYPVIMDLGWGLVDVRDVAKAHVLAMQNDDANGRYICANTTLKMTTLVQYLKTDYSAYKLPTTKMDGGFGTAIVRLMANFQPSGTKSYLKTNLGTLIEFDNTKIKEDLGMEFIDIYETIEDTIQNLITQGHLPAKN